MFAGLLWCNNNRAAGDMPAYAKYGGRNWNAGRNPLDPEDPGAGDDTPEDDMDEAFARHDHNYNIMSEAEADWILVVELMNLPRDTNQWRKPPKYPEYAKRYRFAAIYLFKAKAEYESAFRLPGKSYPEDLLPFLPALRVA